MSECRIAGQISHQSGKCICCQVIHFLPLGNNYSFIPLQKVSFPTCMFLDLHLKAPCGLGMRVYSGRREVWFHVCSEGGEVWSSVCCSTVIATTSFCLLPFDRKESWSPSGSRKAFWALNPKGDVAPKHFHFSSSLGLFQQMKYLSFFLSTLFFLWGYSVLLVALWDLARKKQVQLWGQSSLVENHDNWIIGLQLK